jgi:predicted TIM-barrel fold metal-dependent hydrolase
VIIDTESHVLFRLWPIESNPDRSRVLGYTWHEYCGDLFVDEMDRAGVDRAFLISYDAEDILWFLQKNGSTLEDCVAGKKYTLAAVRKHPDRFYWFTTLKDPRRPDSLDLVEADFAEGAYGIKIFPAFFPLAVDDPSLMPAYRLCAERNRRVIIAFEDTEPPLTPAVSDYFEQLDRLLGQFPELKVQVNHAGCTDPLDPDAEIIFRVTERHENLILSTAWLGMNWDDKTEYPFPNYLRRLARLKEAVGVEKLMWATDWPWLDHFMPYPQAVDAIRKHADFMSDEEKGLFLGENAARFLEGVEVGREVVGVER